MSVVPFRKQKISGQDKNMHWLKLYVYDLWQTLLQLERNLTVSSTVK